MRREDGVAAPAELKESTTSPERKTEISEKEKALQALQRELTELKKTAIANGNLVYENGAFAFAKAPNGEKSELSEDQWLHTRTSSFKKWFGDWQHDPAHASKIINHRTGEPLVVYHSSSNDFDTFDTSYRHKGAGAYFSEGYYPFGTHIMPCFLNIRNPLVRDTNYVDEEKKREAEREGHDGFTISNMEMQLGLKNYLKVAKLFLNSLATQSLNFLGYEDVGYATDVSKAGNSLKIRKNDSHIIKFYEIIAFEPGQIKSAESNSGLYDARSPKITE